MSLNKLLRDSDVVPRLDVSLNSLQMSQVGLDADTTLDSAYSNKTIFLDSSGARALTLPAPSADLAGTKFTVIVSANGAASTLTSGANVIRGHIIVQTNAAVTADIGSGNGTTLTIAAGAQVGDKIELVYSANLIYVSAVSRADAGITVA